MTTPPDELTWRGMKAMDRDGNQIGTVEDIYLDRVTGEPDWATIKTGMLGIRSTFVPIGDASASHDDGELTHEEEEALRRHYGRG